MSNTVVRCYFKTFGDFITAYSATSQTGILIQSAVALPKGAKVRLEFKLRNDYPLVMGEGEIIWVKPEGAGVRFSHFDEDSEKFINEVVKVKAAEIKQPVDQAALLASYEVKVEGAPEGDVNELDNAFDSLTETEEAVEEVDTTETEPIAEPDDSFEDTFADLNDPPAAASPHEEVSDFADLSLDNESHADTEPATDDLLDLPGDNFDAGSAGLATDATDEPIDDQPADLGASDDSYEDVEPAAPAAPAPVFFDDVNESESDVPDQDREPGGETTLSGSTKLFERVSILKERRALLIGGGVGLVTLMLGVGAYFMLSGPKTMAAPETAAIQAPEVQPVAAVQPDAATASTTTAVAAVTAPSAKLEPAPQPIPPAEPTPAPIAAPVQAQVKTPAKAQPQSPASKVIAVEVLADGSVEIIGNGVFGKVKHFTMPEPNRIIVDIYGVTKDFKGLNRSGAGAVAKIRPGEHEGKIRFVLDLKTETGKIPPYTLQAEGATVVIRP